MFLWTSRTLWIVLWTQPARDCVSMDQQDLVDCPLDPACERLCFYGPAEPCAMSSGPSLREIVFLWTSRTLCIVLWTQPARDCVSMDLYSHVDCPLEPVRFASLQERPAAREVIVSTIHTNSVQGTRSLQPPDVLACALNLISVVRVLAADRCWSYFLSLWANDR